MGGVLMSVIVQFSSEADTSIRERTTWVLQDLGHSSEDPENCFQLCSWTLYNHPGCLEGTGEDSTQWNVTRIFDANRTETNLTLAGCSEAWDVAGCKHSSAGAWIGIEFESRRSVQCMRLVQGSSTTSLQLYSCMQDAVPTEQDELMSWR